MNLQLHFWFVQPAAACATYSEGISKIHIPTRIRWSPYPPNAQIRIPAAAPTKDKRNDMKWVADKDDSGRAGFNDSLKDRTAKDCSQTAKPVFILLLFIGAFIRKIKGNRVKLYT